MGIASFRGEGRDMTLKDHVQGKVAFQYYRDYNLYYKTETGVLFPVPIEDIGNATFLAEDRAMLFMRYIRKFLDSVKDQFKLEDDILNKIHESLEQTRKDGENAPDLVKEAKDKT